MDRDNFTDRPKNIYLTGLNRILQLFRVIPSRETEMTINAMEKFHRLLNRYLLDSFGINTEYLTLTKISLPAVTASSDGQVRFKLNLSKLILLSRENFYFQVKISNFDKIKTILGFLTTLSQDRCVLRADPRLGVPIG